MALSKKISPEVSGTAGSDLIRSSEVRVMSLRKLHSIKVEAHPLEVDYLIRDTFYRTWVTQDRNESDRA